VFGSEPLLGDVEDDYAPLSSTSFIMSRKIKSNKKNNS
jgi:hypothetical protein